jgi:multiple sugar transport system substrate-binding protein
MRAVRPFTRGEISSIRGAAPFPPVNWQTGVQGKTVFAIPWTTDVRVIYYRRDLLAQAGIEEETAFATVPQMQETLQSLKSLDGIIPWLMPTKSEHLVLQNIVTWVWQAGGQLMSPDGRHTQFSQPEAMAGMRTHFETFAPLLVKEAQDLAENECVEKFLNGQVATILSGYWLRYYTHRPEANPIIKENLGIALLPIPTFVGGQSLLIWQHTHQDHTAVQLVKYLTQQDVQFKQFKGTNYLPGRLDVLASPDFMDERFSKVYIGGYLISSRH